MKNLEKYLSLLDGEVDGLLLTSRYSRHYGAEFDIAEGVAIVARKGSRYFTDSRYIESAENNLRGFEVLEINSSNGYYKRLNDAIADFGITTLGYEEHYLTAAELMGYEKHLNAKLVPFNKQISGFRGTKEHWELELMRKAQAITDKAFAEVLTRIKPGMTELELQAELIYCMYKNGGTGLAFDPIVVSGPNTSMPHGVATDEMKEVYDTVLKAQLAAIAATKAGVPGKDIDAVARKVISDAGYGEYFGHGYGHSLGLEIHENPSPSAGNPDPMPAGAVCSAEPGIYLPGKFGVRIEDVTILTEDGCEDITASPKNLMIVK